MRSVFASPGTPTNRQLPPAKSAMSACSTIASLPTITLRNSMPMRLLAASRRSASSASSRRSNSEGRTESVKRFPRALSAWISSSEVQQQRLRLFERRRLLQYSQQFPSRGGHIATVGQGASQLEVCVEGIGRIERDNRSALPQRESPIACAGTQLRE